MDDADEIRKLLGELADDEAASASRIAVCEAIAAALVHVGHVLWVYGWTIGPDRVSGASPFRFGNDHAVGVATVCQIGGELATGAIALLEADNIYAANALIRQLVEVEYLSDAFAAEDEIAAQWLRADGDERRTFWSPAKLRARADGRFLSRDYWHHCDMGGHPTTQGMALLPGHEGGLNAAYYWADMAAHLSGIWRSTATSMTRLLGDDLPDEWRRPEVEHALEHWTETDGFSAALHAFHQVLRDDPEALDAEDDATTGP